MDKRYHFASVREIIIIAAVAIAVICFAVAAKSDGGSYAVISCGDIVEEVRLDKDAVLRFDGINAAFRVSGGKIRLEDAVCPDRICEKTGYIGSPGESIVCIPEKITVTVKSGESESGTDVTVG